MTNYLSEIEEMENLCTEKGDAWNGINPEYAVRMKLQNRFQSGLDIARHTAAVMRKDMADYDTNTSKYTQSLGCWHGFVAQQKAIAIKRHLGTLSKKYIYLSGWMVAALKANLDLFRIKACTKRPLSHH